MNRRASPGRKRRIMAGGVEETSNPSLEVITMVTNGGQAIGHVAKEDWGEEVTLRTPRQSISGRCPNISNIRR